MQLGAAGKKLLLLAGFQACGIDLSDLESQNITQSVGFCAVTPYGRKRFFRRTQGGIDLPIFCECNRIQNPCLNLSAQKQSVVILTVNADQIPGKLAEHGLRDHSPVEPTFDLALCREGALQQQLLPRLDPHFTQIGKAGLTHIGKHTADGCHFFACAHQLSHGLPAKQKGKRIDHHRFAGAGLTRDHRETAGKIHIQPGDHRHVLNMKRI